MYPLFRRDLHNACNPKIDSRSQCIFYTASLGRKYIYPSRVFRKKAPGLTASLIGQHIYMNNVLNIRCHGGICTFPIDGWSKHFQVSCIHAIESKKIESPDHLGKRTQCRTLTSQCRPPTMSFLGAEERHNACNDTSRRISVLRSTYQTPTHQATPHRGKSNQQLSTPTKQS